MSANIISSETARFMRPIVDAWSGLLEGAAGVADKDKDGRPIHRHATYSEKPLARLVSDAAPGSIVGSLDDGDTAIYARARRWDVAEDIGWSTDEVQQFANLRSGLIERAPSAIKTGCKLTDVRGIDELRERLRDPKDGDKWALALTPARLDDAPGLFIASELMVHLPEIVRVERVMPYARSVFPMRFLNAPGAESYRFTVLDDHGDAQWASNMDGTVPMIGQKRQQIRRPLEYLWMGAQWGLRELMQWQQARSNGSRLPDFTSERPRIAREALLRQENLWLFFGGPKGSNILGLFSTDQGITKTAPSNHWTTLSAQALLTLVQDQVTAIRTTFTEVADTILMPVGMYDWCATKQWDNTDKMLLEVMMSSLRKLGISEIVAIPECSYSAALKDKLVSKGYSAADAERYAGGVDGKDAMVVLSRREEKVCGIVSQDIKTLPPKVEPTKTSVTLILGSGGLEVRYPKAHRIVPFNPA